MAAPHVDQHTPEARTHREEIRPPCSHTSSFFFLAAPYGMWDVSPPTRIKPICLQWKCRVLTSGPPGKSSPLPFMLRSVPSHCPFLYPFSCYTLAIFPPASYNWKIIIFRLQIILAPDWSMDSVIKRQMLQRGKKKLSVQSWVGVCNVTNQTISIFGFPTFIFTKGHLKALR